MLTGFLNYLLLHTVSCVDSINVPAHISNNIPCVLLTGPNSVFNRRLCEEIGLSPCSSSSSICNINPLIAQNASNKEMCLKTLLGFFASISCKGDSKPKEYIFDGKDDIVVVYVCKEFCKTLWKACSPRAETFFADILSEDESKKFCKELTLKSSHVQIRQRDYSPCISNAIVMRSEEVAELNWLLGDPINWNLIKSKGSGVCIILFLFVLTLTTIYLKRGYSHRKRKVLDSHPGVDEINNFIELDLNMYR